MKRPARLLTISASLTIGLGLGLRGPSVVAQQPADDEPDPDVAPPAPRPSLKAKTLGEPADQAPINPATARAEIEGILDVLALEKTPERIDEWLGYGDEELHDALASRDVDLPVERITKHRGTLVILDEVTLVLEPPPSTEVVEANFEEWSKWRQEQGFPGSWDAVLGAAQSPNGLRSYAAWGAPFTLEEEREIIERDQIREQRGPMLEAAMKSGGYGGFWTDPRTGDSTVAFVEGTDPEVVSAALALYPARYSDRLSVAMVESTYAELEAVKNALSQAQIDGIRYLPPLAGVGIAQEQNSVSLILDGTTGALPSTEEVTAKIRRDYDVSAVVTISEPSIPQTCTARNICNDPHRGGTTVPECTGAFVAHSNANGNEYVMTAGHCFDGTADTTDLNIAGYSNSIQDASSNKYFANSEADAVRIQIENSRRSNFIYRSDVSEALMHWAITSVQNEGASNDEAGDPVCLSGRSSKNPCGSILDVNFDNFTADGFFILDQNVASYTNDVGDSGGSVYYDHQAYGIHSHKKPGNGQAIYTHIEEAELAMGLSVRTTK